MLKIISDKALALHRKVEYLFKKSMRGRSALTCLNNIKDGQSYIHNTIRRNELADFLNVSRPSLSREMSRLMEEGIIDYLGHQLN